MLVLSRRRAESIVITLPDGRVVTITVVEISRGNVRIGIEAPRDLPILRGELAAPDPPGPSKYELDMHQQTDDIRREQQHAPPWDR